MVDSGLIRICDSASLVDGGPGVRFNAAPEAPAFAVRHGGRVVAYFNRCAHLGLELDWTDARFFDAQRRWLICAVHGALYEPSDGSCAAGPCAGFGGLRPIDVVELDGAVYLRPAAASR